MTRKFMITSIAMIFAGIILQTHTVQTKVAGAPSGRTGSPGDNNATCATGNCHAGGSTFMTGIMSSNIPVEGYEPGQLYTITATLTDPNKVRFGFEISPQDLNGNLLGSMTVTDGVTTKIISTKWITHKQAGTSGAGGKTWNFDWIAPAAGTGDVTFYGAFNYSNNDQHKTGDVIKTSTMMVAEHDTLSSSIQSVLEKEFLIDLFPNPAYDHFSLSFGTIVTGDAEVMIYDITGKIVARLFNGYFSGENLSLNISEIQLESGIYFVQTFFGEKLYLNKLIIQ